mgnify:CR=1 FL=1
MTHLEKIYLESPSTIVTLTCTPYSNLTPSSFKVEVIIGRSASSLSELSFSKPSIIMGFGDGFAIERTNSNISLGVRFRTLCSFSVAMVTVRCVVIF